MGFRMRKSQKSPLFFPNQNYFILAVVYLLEHISSINLIYVVPMMICFRNWPEKMLNNMVVAFYSIGKMSMFFLDMCLLIVVHFLLLNHHNRSRNKNVFYEQLYKQWSMKPREWDPKECLLSIIQGSEALMVHCFEFHHLIIRLNYKQDRNLNILPKLEQQVDDFIFSYFIL